VEDQASNSAHLTARQHIHTDLPMKTPDLELDNATSAVDNGICRGQ
jgi:hypothetical protein